MKMGLIQKPVDIVGDKGRATVQALFDTGASASFLREDIANRVATIARWPTIRSFTLGDGKTAISTDRVVNLDIIIKGVSVFFPLLVVQEMGEEMIVGADMLQRWKITLDPEKEDLFIDEKALRLRL